MTVRTTARPSLPDWLDAYVTAGLYGLVLGALLCLLALFTNPVPDPSFPALSLPASLRLPVGQPRIEHWPVTYTMGIWLWVGGLPAVFLAGYRRFGHRTPFGSTVWLAGLPVLSMVALATYCRLFWPKLHPATWNAPSYTFVCWLYCATYDAVWSDAAYAVGLVGVAATLLAVRRRTSWALLGFGLLALPLGLPAAYEGYRRRRRDTG